MSDEWLFSYGTLRDPAVQLATFGRTLDGRPDALVGWRTELLEISDPQVVATSGSTHHPILVETGEPGDVVTGHALLLTGDDLVAADAYEVDDYRRARTTLGSGLEAWVYVRA